jgi:hypothetical protein
MTDSPLHALDVDAQTAKRAQYEAFEFAVEGSDVTVTNGSHADPKEHTYTVHVEGRIPSDCTCPAWEYQEGPCKHMTAVAIREPLLNAIDGATKAVTDGGEDTADEEDDGCDCRSCRGDGLPCFEQYEVDG